MTNPCPPSPSPPPHKTSPHVFGALKSCAWRPDKDYTSLTATIDKSKGAARPPSHPPQPAHTPPWDEIVNVIAHQNATTKYKSRTKIATTDERRQRNNSVAQQGTSELPSH